MIALSSMQKLLLLSLIAGMFLSYIIFAFRSYLLGPSLVLFEPIHGGVVESSLTTIRGNAHSISEISINDRPIFISPDGNFADQLLLSYGYNIIEVTAKDRYDRSVSKQLLLTLR